MEFPASIDGVNANVNANQSQLLRTLDVLHSSANVAAVSCELLTRNRMGKG
jgi:hypothetical protein